MFIKALGIEMHVARDCVKRWDNAKFRMPFRLDDGGPGLWNYEWLCFGILVVVSKALPRKVIDWDNLEDESEAHEYWLPESPELQQAIRVG